MSSEIATLFVFFLRALRNSITRDSPQGKEETAGLTAISRRTQTRRGARKAFADREDFLLDVFSSASIWFFVFSPGALEGVVTNVLLVEADRLSCPSTISRFASHFAVFFSFYCLFLYFPAAIRAGIGFVGTTPRTAAGTAVKAFSVARFAFPKGLSSRSTRAHPLVDGRGVHQLVALEGLLFSAPEAVGKATVATREAGAFEAFFAVVLPPDFVD